MKIILTLLMALLLILGISFAHYGGFYKVVVTEAEIGPYHLVYESNTGSYKQTGGSVQKLMDFAKRLDVKPVAGFGMYMDDPKKVPEAELRSDAGIVVADVDIVKVQANLGNYKYKPYGVTKAVVADFPFKGFPSVLLGLFRVYPAITKYMTDKGYVPTHSFEIYETENQRTVYAFPL